MLVHFPADLRCWCVRLLLVLLIVVTFSSVAFAEGPAVRVEEDWELVIATPDPDRDAPQVTCVLSPQGSLDSYYVTFELNHQSELTFEAGGLQLQIWDAEALIGDKGYPDRNILATAGETITWTQSVEVRDGVATFEVTNGSSTTWGTFGGQGYLKAMLPTELSNVSGSSSAVSTGHSGVSYAANRVGSLTLKKVRYYNADGKLIAEDTAPKVVQSL